MSSPRLLEKSVQAALARYYAGQGYVVKREVNTPVGYIDFLLYRHLSLPDREKILIEVKEHKGIKHAIGQVYSYRKYHSDITEARIVYFTRDSVFKPIDHSFLTENIRFQCVHSFLPTEELYRWQTNRKSCKLSMTSSTTETSQQRILEESSYPTEMSMVTSLPSEMESILMSNEKVLGELNW